MASTWKTRWCLVVVLRASWALRPPAARAATVGAALDDVTAEVSGLRVEVAGTLPPYLRGTYYRNGPGAWRAASQPLTHLFDGFALLCKWRFDDGGCEFTSRFLATEARRGAGPG